MSTTKLLSIGSVADALDVSDKTIRRWLAAGNFPRPVVLPNGEYRWHDYAIQSWAATLLPAEPKPETEEPVKKKTA
jgi:predicted DNA-binding transcriptional regulator AlpA